MRTLSSISVSNRPTMAMFFLLIFRILFAICVTSFTPVDHFAVSSGNSPFTNGRKWTGDIDSGHLSPIKLSDGNKSSVSPNALGETIPYDTARFSRSEFSYLFPVKTDGQMFIRLYFYRSSYSYLNFLPSDSFFFIRVGSHTLLKDFNASITADDAGKETILREYCVNVVDPSEGPGITFMPSQTHQNTYAFVNGIEVVSMPTFLYYTNPDNLLTMMLDGGIRQFPVKNNSALETVYRINVGGSQIPSDEDTGMFCYWDDDIAYLKSGERQHSVSVGFGLKKELDQNDYPNYSAPDDVYLTARNYGMDETSKFNVTWEFQVDSEFIYMVRLHFCEFDETIQKSGDRVLQIFINDALVEITVEEG